MEKAKQIMEKESGGGEKKCFWWPRARGLELLGCVYMNKLNQIFLFHYDANNRLGLVEKLNQIISLSQRSQMKLENNQWIPLTQLAKLAFAWLHKLGGEFIPKDHCSIAEKGGVKKNYTLVCKSLNNRQSEQIFINESIVL